MTVGVVVKYTLDVTLSTEIVGRMAVKLALGEQAAENAALSEMFMAPRCPELEGAFEGVSSRAMKTHGSLLLQKGMFGYSDYPCLPILRGQAGNFVVVWPCLLAATFM